MIRQRGAHTADKKAGRTSVPYPLLITRKLPILLFGEWRGCSVRAVVMHTVITEGEQAAGGLVEGRADVVNDGRISNNQRTSC